jgi:hypothetical protein
MTNWVSVLLGAKRPFGVRQGPGQGQQRIANLLLAQRIPIGHLEVAATVLLDR